MLTLTSTRVELLTASATLRNTGRAAANTICLIGGLAAPRTLARLVTFGISTPASRIGAFLLAWKSEREFTCACPRLDH